MSIGGDKVDDEVKLDENIMAQSSSEDGQNSREQRPTMKKGRSRRIRRMDSQVLLPRLIKRNYAYDQSSNRVQIVNENSKQLVPLLMKDWFHVVLRVQWYLSLPFFILVWYAMIWVFAGFYVWIDGTNFNSGKDCGLGEPGNHISLPTAYAFSLETCTTVGYGLPGSANGFFNADCEGIQIVFSKKLCINVIEGKVCISVRCYDLDSAHPLVECHARMYLIDHKMKFHPLRLLEPNDDLGGVLYPSAPTTIVHHIDHHSALSPSSMPLTEGNHGLTLRSVDSATGGRDEIICPVCGEAYGTYERFMKHIEYQRIVEEQDEYPVEGTHRGFEMPDTTPVTLAEVQRHIERKLSEIVVVVEAIDPQLSGTCQALQSYKYDDIEFGAGFERCMSTRNDKFVVDLLKFHGIIYDDEMYSSAFKSY